MNFQVFHLHYLFSFGHVAGEHAMEVGNGGSQDDLVRLEPGVADPDDDVTQRLALAKVIGDRESHVG